MLAAISSGSAERAGQRFAYRVSPSRWIAGKILQFDSPKALTEIRLLFPTYALCWPSSLVLRWPSTHIASSALAIRGNDARTDVACRQAICTRAEHTRIADPAVLSIMTSETVFHPKVLS